MIKLIESKQVGELSYFVSDIDILTQIIYNEEILCSQKAELNPDTHRKEHYVSFSRDLLSTPKRNPKRWKFGIVVDGDKLSDKYSITPISYSGVTMNYSNLRVKSITAYDNNTYTLNLINWPTINITQNVYNSIVNEINNMSNNLKELKRYVHTDEGKYIRNGRKIKAKDMFDVPTGGLILNYKKYPEICTALSKTTVMNETEERIWIRNGYFVNIHNCIKAIILPNNVEEDRDFEELMNVLNTKNITKVIYY